MACLYFLEPITTVLCGTKSWVQWQCPCKIFHRDSGRGETFLPPTPTYLSHDVMCQFNNLSNSFDSHYLIPYVEFTEYVLDLCSLNCSESLSAKSCSKVSLSLMRLWWVVSLVLIASLRLWGAVLIYCFMVWALQSPLRLYQLERVVWICFTFSSANTTKAFTFWLTDDGGVKGPWKHF